jgi:dTDP-4-dehydrorhamnose 3,5-epimerase
MNPPTTISSAEPIRDRPTVTPEGVPLVELPHGVVFRDAVTHVDDRGMLCELFDNRWGFPGGPLCYSYFMTIRPGYAKGWGWHSSYDDRYFIQFGHMETVLYDERDDSPTRGLVARVVLSETRRRLMVIPAGVWHASRNLGDRDVVVVNFPTKPYVHQDPDKARLPLDNDRIPYRFPPGTRGG